MTTQDAPGQGLAAQRMPGHWLLARLGKRVLRPGGLELTERLVAALDVGADDRVVEFAPGLGATAKLTLARGPASYTGVEQNEQAAALVRRALHGETRRCLVGEAQDTGLPDGAATVVYGEAMLTMQPAATKAAIAAEAFRLLAPGGRYGIHEMALVPDDVGDAVKTEISTGLSRVIHHGIRPLTESEWRAVLEQAGFVAERVERADMRLLEPRRLVADEGLRGALRFVGNVLRDGEARRRVLRMRGVFRRFRDNLGAIALVARRPS